MKFSYLLLTIAYCAGIFWLSSQSEPIKVAHRFPGDDKVVHGLLYAGLAAVVSLGLRRSGRPVPLLRQFWFPVLFACAYGLSDEIHQLYVPQRSFELLDIAADGGGGLLMQWYLCSVRWKLWVPTKPD